MLLGTSCQNEEIVSRAEGQEFSLTLDMGAKSRTMMGENGAVWGDNEALYVVGDGGKSYGTLTMVWKSEDGKSAMFSGKITGDASKLEHMVYPVPNEDNQIPMFTLDGANHNAPMVGSIEGGEVTDLGYVGGLVKVKVNGEVGENGVTLKAVEGNNANAGTSVVAGYYQFNPTSGTLEYKQYEDGEGENNTVTVTNIPENGIIYLPVDTDATKDNAETITVSLTIGDKDPVVAQVKVAENGATESGENSFPVVNYDEVEGVVSSKVGTLDELKNALSIGGEYELTNDIETSEVLQIGKNVEIKGNGHTVTSSANRVFRITASKVNVVMNKVKMVSTAVREGTNDIRGISIDVNLEGIGLALDTCSVDFTDESAHDWSYAVNVSGNTNHCGITIIGGSYEGANVINVHGTGHGIQIEGTTLTSLYQPNEQYYGVCIKLEENGNNVIKNNNKYYGDHAVDFEWPGGSISITGGGDENFTQFAIAKVGDQYCYTLEEAATKKGEIITLFNDAKLNNNIELSIPLYIKGNVTLDLNNKFIAPSEGFTINDNDVNSTIVVFNDKQGESKTVIKNGEIAGNGKAKRTIYAYGYNAERNAELILETENLAIINQRTDGWGTGVLLGYDITMNANAKTKITTVGTYSSVETSSGAVMNVKDGVTIEHSTKNIENSLGAALSAGYVSTINVFGGTVTSDKYAVYALPTGGTINISNGIFTGLIKEDTANNLTVEVNISGGTFSVDPTSYLASSATATEVAEGQWIVNSKQ